MENTQNTQQNKQACKKGRKGLGIQFDFFCPRLPLLSHSRIGLCSIGFFFELNAIRFFYWLTAWMGKGTEFDRAESRNADFDLGLHIPENWEKKELLLFLLSFFAHPRLFELLLWPGNGPKNCFLFFWGTVKVFSGWSVFLFFSPFPRFKPFLFYR